MSFQMILSVDVVDPVTGERLSKDAVSPAWFRRDREGHPSGIADLFGRGLGATLFPIHFIDDSGTMVEAAIAVEAYATQHVVKRWVRVSFDEKGVVDLFTTDADEFVLDES